MNGTQGMPLHLWRLMDAHFNGVISDNQVRELESLLLANDKASQTFLEYSRLHAELHLLAAARNAADPRPASGYPGCPDTLMDERPRPMPPETMANIVRGPKVSKSSALGFRRGASHIRRHAPSVPTAKRMVAILCACTVACLLVLVGVLFHGNRNNVRGDRSGMASPLPVQSSAGPIAQLTREAHCQWADARHSHRLGDRFAAGQQLDLAKGVVELRFDCGVRIVLQGPARAEPASATALRLQSGKMTAEILRPEARGFQVQTPKGNVVDLGTEFGVEVTPCQDVEVHVFRGEVMVQRPADPSAGSHVLRNQGLRMEGGTAGPLLVEDPGETYIRTIDDADRDQHVVAYWRFEDHPVGEVVADTSGNTKPVRGTVDSSFNGNDLFTYSASTRPRFSGDVPAPCPGATGSAPRGDTGLLQSGASNHGCLDNTAPPVEGAPTRDLYTRSRVSHAAPIDIQTVKLARWTIEASVKAKILNAGIQTFVGRDGGQGAVMSFRINPQDRFEIYFKDVKHHSHRAVAKLPIRENQWYHLATVSDGRDLRLYVDARDGRGYQLCATSYLYPEHGPTVLGPSNKNAEWSVGRGRMNRVTCEWFQGWIDEVRICDVALAPSEFLFAPRGQGKQPEAVDARPARGGASAKPCRKTSLDGALAQ